MPVPLSIWIDCFRFKPSGSHTISILALLLDKLFSSTETYSENSPNIFSLIDFLFNSALTTTDKSTTIVFFLWVVVQV